MRTLPTLGHVDDPVLPTLSARDILAALAEYRVVAALQPIITLPTLLPFAHEALARLVTTETIYAADQFIDAAETAQIAWAVDLNVLAHACHQWRGGLLFVNVTPSALCDDRFVRRAHAIVQASHVPFCQLVFEVTEREILRDVNNLTHNVRWLSSLGVRFALDDFLPSKYRFALIRAVEPGFLKLPGFLVEDAFHNRSLKTVDNIQHIAKRIGAVVIAEHVSSAQCVKLMSDMGVTLGQGYLLGMPAITEHHINA